MEFPIFVLLRSFGFFRIVQGVDARVAKVCELTKSVHIDFVESLKENVPGGHTRIFKDSEGASRLLNTLEERLCRVGTSRVTENFVKSSRRELSRYKECIEPIPSKVLEKLRKYRVFEYSVSSKRSVLRKCIECTDSTLRQVLRTSEDLDERKVSVGSELVSSSKYQEV
jgi:hypothetical protein